MKKVEKTFELGGRKLTLTTGTLAEQATGAVLATYGETVVLSTVVAAPLKVDLGYFPLTVDYQERLYAGGRIKGSRWVKREGRPSDDEILTSRLIDRSIRPLLPESYKKEVQVIITVLSVDLQNDPSILAAIATSAAIAISTIPWKGPVGTLRVGMKDGAYSTNPLDSEMATSEMDLIVSSTKDAIVMIEAGGNQVSEKDFIGAVDYANKEAQKIIKAIGEMAKEIGKTKENEGESSVSPEVVGKVKKLIDKKLDSLIEGMLTHFGDISETKEALIAELAEENASAVSLAFDKILKEKFRKLVLSGKRIDGRKPEEIRKLSSEVGILPRTHGSAVFQRGQTQVLSVTTLGSPSLEQLIESAEGEESKRFMHHYSMPPYASGETGRVGYPSRREIGHGALAERALEPVLPAEDKFPYTIRIVSEVTSSNGSTSMASTCGSTLSLMDAGVPITAPVSGIAMGLVIESDKKYAVLTDIIGLEDYMGDMDFKIAGTQKGITAVQLDVKTLNLNPAILKEALQQAKEGRETILQSMLKTISVPRENLSSFAPKVKMIKVPVEKIGEVIGPGGRMIKKIIAETGAQVEVEDDGTVSVSGTEDAGVKEAIERIEGLIKEVQAGEIYEGEVKRIQPFGAFVGILPNKDGLVHVSDMGEGFVKDPHDVVKLGDKIKVRVKEIDEMGRVNLSMNMDASKDKPRGEKREGFSGRRFDRRDNRGFVPRGHSSGPHFPTSRFVDSKKKSFR
jgi:polyribonucleotide nucleotidyltransferase